MSLRKQVFAVLSATALFTAASVSLLLFFLIQKSILNNAFNLLQISHNASLKKIASIGQTKNSQEVVDYLADRRGLGESGESYLLDMQGNLISPSRFTKTPKAAPIPSDFETFWSGTKMDYRGILVLAVWTKLEDRILATEIDYSEVIAPLKSAIDYIVAVLLLFIFGIFLVSGFVSELLAKNYDFQTLQNNLRKASLVDGQERERERIGMDLHDDIAPRITSIQWKISNLDFDSEIKNEVLDQLNALITEVRLLSSQNSTWLIRHHGILEAYGELKRRYEKKFRSMGMDFTVVLDRKLEDVAINAEALVMLYRVAQESLNNAIKHSQAKNVSFAVTVEKNEINVKIVDDGVGFEQAEQSGLGKMGLFNMQTRAEIIGAKMHIDSAKDDGTEVHLTLPIEDMKV